MAVKIIEAYATPEECLEYSEFLDAHSYENDRGHMFNALGYESSLAASRVNGETGVIEGNQDPMNKKLGQLFENIKLTAQEVLGQELDLCQANYQLLLTGAFNGLHADAMKLDGSPIHDDGTFDELEWSGLLYLNTYGEDFTGGTLYFPEFDLTYYPQVGDLVLFKGDVEHRHEVSKVLSGKRKNILFFWANKGNISDRNFFDVRYIN